jgi:hypothetical protein
LSNSSFSSSDAEVGIIDCHEVNVDAAKSEKKWVLQRRVQISYSDTVFLTLDMEKRSLNVRVNSTYFGSSKQNYQFTARRVSPFFACNSPHFSITLVE